jgi:hypothetical protein
MELKGYKIDTKSMTLDEVINSVLYEITTNNESEYLRSQFTYTNRDFYKIMENHGLVTLEKYTPKLTPLAYEVHRKGGWGKWLESEKKAKERQTSLEQTTISNNKVQKMMIILTGFIVCANLWVDNENLKYTKMNYETKSKPIDTLLQLQKVQQQLKNIQQEILILNQRDSLNHAHNDTMDAKHDK